MVKANVRLTFLLLAAALLIFTSCAGNQTPVAPDTKPDSTDTPSQIASYTIADPTGDWGYPSPYTRYSRGPGYTRMSFIFETIVWKDASGFVPQLAKEWEYIKEENAYVFRLRDNVTWHDGTKFTAEDVAFTIDYMKSHPDPFVTLIGPSGVEKAEIIDKYIVKLYLEQLYAPFLNDIAGTMAIIPRHIWESVEEPMNFTEPEAVIGTGPYMLGDYSKEHGTYLYKAYKDYYLGKPRVDEIKFVKVSNEMAPAAVRNGSVNAASIPPEVAFDMKKEGLTIITAPAAWNAKLTINHRKEPFSSKQFRQALAYAIDRQSMVEIAYRGHGIAGSPGMIPPTSEWYNPDIPQYEYDTDKTRQLLEGLGYKLEDGYFTKGGKVLELELITTALFKEDGEFIKQQLEKAGIKIDFKTLEGKTVDSKVQAWDFDLSVYGHGGLYEPSILNKVIANEGFNSARWDSNETLNQLLEAQLREMDIDKRKAMIFDIQEVYAEDLPALTLYYPKWYWSHDGKVNLFYTKDGIASGIPIPLNRIAFMKE